MITKSTTMLYVADTEVALQFWSEQVGFVLIDQAQQEGTSSYEIAPNKESAISFGLHNKEVVAAANPGMDLGFPSLLFETDHLQAEYERLTAAGVATNPIMEYQGMIHFTFSDNEGHYIAVRQSTSPKGA
ncbi:VOC family protein [Streptococcus dysgalactiae]|uniref:VOC family protein n=1 Tax=Streptococcus dysgalactiae TaxID=1334 RepID=UPI001C4C9B25|nr:VOC family protein [Streptococcus dysgalactiae]